TIRCYTIFDDVYGGSNKADIVGNVTLNVEGGSITNLFGGSKGTAETAANISGNVTLNIYGGTIGNAFGGCNVNGQIGGQIVVNVINNSSCGFSINNVYGGGQDAAYGTSESNRGNYPQVNIMHTGSARVNNNVFGGGLGATAQVYGNPQVTVGYTGTITVGTTDVTTSPTVTIGENVFGGGSAAQVNGDTKTTVKGSSVVGKNVFGGGNEAAVDGDTDVRLLDKVRVYGNVYGGGNQGEVTGDTKVIVNGN
ncbi:MAG: hypothetical protein J6031_08035, partial [Bacteroidales bacterium]|nr:hypothetical protein [Bacteroidales bacterium]